MQKSLFENEMLNIVQKPTLHKTDVMCSCGVLIDVAAMKNYCSAVLFFLNLRSILKRNYECIEFV